MCCVTFHSVILLHELNKNIALKVKAQNASFDITLLDYDSWFIVVFITVTAKLKTRTVDDDDVIIFLLRMQMSP